MRKHNYLILLVISAFILTLSSGAVEANIPKIPYQPARPQMKINKSLLNRNLSVKKRTWLPSFYERIIDYNNKIGAIRYKSCYEFEYNNSREVVWPTFSYLQPNTESKETLSKHQFFNRGTTYWVPYEIYEEAVNNDKELSVADVSKANDYCASETMLVEYYCTPMPWTVPGSYNPADPQSKLMCGQKYEYGVATGELLCTAKATSEKMVDCSEWGAICKNGACTFPEPKPEPEPVPEPVVTCNDKLQEYDFQLTILQGTKYEKPGEWHYSACTGYSEVTHYICGAGVVDQLSYQCENGSPCENGLCTGSLEPACYSTNPVDPSGTLDLTSPSYTWSGSVSGLTAAASSFCDYYSPLIAYFPKCISTKSGFMIDTENYSCPPETVCVPKLYFAAGYCEPVEYCDGTLQNSSPLQPSLIKMKSISMDEEKIYKNSCTEGKTGIRKYGCDGKSMTYSVLPCPEGTSCCGKQKFINNVPGYYDVCDASCGPPVEIPDKHYSCNEGEDTENDPTVPGGAVVDNLDDNTAPSLVSDYCYTTGQIVEMNCIAESLSAKYQSAILHGDFITCPEEAPFCVSDLQDMTAACSAVPNCISTDTGNDPQFPGKVKIKTTGTEYETYYDICENGQLTQVSCAQDNSGNAFPKFHDPVLCDEQGCLTNNTCNVAK